MQNTVENSVMPEKKHSGYGIASTVMSISASAVFAPLMWSFVTKDSLGGIPLWGALLMVAVDIVAFCLGCVGLYQVMLETRKGVFSVIGTAWSFFMFFPMWYLTGLMIILRGSQF